MKRFRIGLELGLLLVVVALATLAWKNRRSQPDPPPAPTESQDAGEASRLRGFLKEHQPTNTTRTITATAMEFVEEPGAEAEVIDEDSEVVEEVFATLFLELLDPTGQPLLLPAQVFSTDCGFTESVEGGQAELLLPPGRCRIQAQAQDGAFLHRSQAVDVELLAGELLELSLVFSSASLAGPGIFLAPQENYAVIEAVEAGSPAEALYLQPGHIIIEIDGVPVDGMSTEELNGALQGPAASSVRLTMLMQNDAGEFEEVTVSTLRQHRLPTGR